MCPSLTCMYFGIDSMLSIKLSDTEIEIEDQTRSNTCSSSSNKLGGGFTAATFVQNSPKGVL